MKTITNTFLAFILVLTFGACSFTGDGFSFPKVDLPVEIGIAYQLEEGLVVIAEPGAKGGLDVRIEGEGEISEKIRKIDGGFEIVGDSGTIYQITEGEDGKPRVSIRIESEVDEYASK